MVASVAFIDLIITEPVRIIVVVVVVVVVVVHWCAINNRMSNDPRLLL